MSSFKAKNASSKSRGKKDDDDKEMGDWITSLAKQVASSSAANPHHHPPVLSKQERVQKRATKKARRQEQKQQLQHPNRKQQQREGKVQAKIIPTKRTKEYNSSLQQRRLKRLAELCLSLQKEHHHLQKQQQRWHAPDKESDRIKRKHALNEENIQPRPCDYSGIGLARRSLFLPFQDPSHIPKLEEEFQEHIPGFFGKQRTRAMKRQLDGNMLWRKLADQREKGGGILPKKIAQLPPDQRVQAMIDAGML